MMDTRCDPIVEYAHMIGKNTAELTAGDMSKFTKWWMEQPIREDLYDMKKKKQVVKKVETKKAETKKPSNVGKNVVDLAKKISQLATKENLKLKKDDIKKVAIKTVQPKKIVEENKSRSFEDFKRKKEQERQVTELPVPTDIDQIDDSEADDLRENLRNRTWRSAKPIIEHEDEEILDDIEDEEEAIENDEETIEDDEDVVEEEEAEVVEEEQVEDVQLEEEQIEELPPDDTEVCKMGLTALDVEALKYVLVEAVKTSSEGAFEIPEEYMLTVEAILEGLNNE
jgi:hypothetical protein